ncbi:porin [Salmonella enterica]|nr:porin [Salmonella enterica]
MKSKLALFVISALALGSSAHAAEIFNKDGNKLDLYGKMKGEYDFDGGKGKHENHDGTYARLGIKGETQINNALTGYGQFEYNIPANKPEDFQAAAQTRLAFAGLSYDHIGSIDYGRNYGVLYDIGSYTDTLTEFGGDSYQLTDNFMNSRANSLLTYRAVDGWGYVDGLTFGLQYQGANHNGSFDKQNGQGLGTSLQYTIGDTGVTVGGAYSHSRAVKAQTFDKTVNGKSASAWALGTKYDANGIYAAALYSQTKNMTPVAQDGSNGGYVLDKTQNIEVMAAYTFDFGLRPSIGYVQSKGQFGDLKADVQKYVQIGAAYYFNKNFNIDAGYKINLLGEKSKELGFKTDNQARIGMTYQF